MKEVWVKVVSWRRHLVEEDVIDEVEAILSGTHRDYAMFVDCYDRNLSQEYDNEVVFVNSDQKIDFSVNDEPDF